MNKALYVPISKVAELLSISRSHAYELVSKGVLPVIPLGPRLNLVPMSAILDLAKQARPMTEVRAEKEGAKCSTRGGSRRSSQNFVS